MNKFIFGTKYIFLSPDCISWSADFAYLYLLEFQGRYALPNSSSYTRARFTRFPSDACKIAEARCARFLRSNPHILIPNHTPLIATVFPNPESLILNFILHYKDVCLHSFS
jgi:hypothetical protein